MKTADYSGIITWIFKFLQQINVKNLHPVYSAGIQTHNYKYMRLLIYHKIRVPAHAPMSVFCVDEAWALR